MALILNRGVNIRKKLRESIVCSFCGCCFIPRTSDRFLDNPMRVKVVCPNTTCKNIIEYYGELKEPQEGDRPIKDKTRG